MCEHAVVRTPAVQNKSLMPSGTPSSGPPSPFASRASDARAMSRARSGVSSTKALSARAFAIAARCASASSVAENSLSAQRVARLRQRKRGKIGHSAVGSSQENGLFAAGFGAGVFPSALAVASGCGCPTRIAPATAAPGMRRTAPRPPPDRQASTNPGFRGKRARWRLVRRRDTWHSTTLARGKMICRAPAHWR